MPPFGARLDGSAHRGDGVRVFRADVDVALARADGQAAIAMPSISAKGSPSMSMRSAKVPLSPSSALHGDELQRPGRARNGPPLHPGGEARTAPATQPRRDDLLDNGLGGHAQRPPQPDPPAVPRVVVGIGRVDDAQARRGQASLSGHPRVLVQRAEVCRVVGFRGRPGRSSWLARTYRGRVGEQRADLAW
jgi:hypothetical protein